MVTVNADDDVAAYAVCSAEVDRMIDPEEAAGPFSKWLCERMGISPEWVITETWLVYDLRETSPGRWALTVSTAVTFEPSSRSDRYRVFDALELMSRRKGEIERWLEVALGLEIHVDEAVVLGPAPAKRPQQADEAPDEGDKAIHRRLGPTFLATDDL